MSLAAKRRSWTRLRAGTALLCLLIWSPAAAKDSAAAVPCTYVARTAGTSGNVGFEPHAGCAVVSSDGTVSFAAAHLARMAADPDGLARVFAAGRWFYVRPTGEHLEVVADDNGPDEFSEGLARGPRGGRIGYFDRTFREVVAATFDWGWPFEGGRARVCRGCVLGPPDGDGHRTVSGGLWGYIDPSGREVVPVNLTEEAVGLLGEQP
jgi:hypothetical protein